MDLLFQNLIPHIIRLKGDVDENRPADARSILHKILQIFESEASITSDEIDALADILDVNSTDPEYLLYISATLGLMRDSGRGETFQRWFVQNLVDFHKIRGTHPSWEKQFVWLQSFHYQAWELWKSIPHETFNYSRVQEYGALLRAARFDLYYVDAHGNNVFLSPAQAIDLVPYIDSIRPIHVTLRYLGQSFPLSDTMPVVDSLGGELEGSLEDTIPLFTDTVFLTVDCTLACELSCQNDCESGCVAGGCELGCQQACETTCEDTCEDACQTAAQAVDGGEAVACAGCETACQGGCTGGVQSICDLDCVLDCEA